MSIADEIIDGELCEECQFPLKELYFMPSTCTECGGEAERVDVDD